MHVVQPESGEYPPDLPVEDRSPIFPGSDAYGYNSLVQRLGHWLGLGLGLGLVIGVLIDGLDSV